MKTTQQQIAARCGVSQPLISKFLCGKFPKSLRRHIAILKCIEEMTGVSIPKLLARAEKFERLNKTPQRATTPQKEKNQPQAAPEPRP